MSLCRTTISRTWGAPASRSTGADYLSIIGNTVDHYTNWSPYANSGISVFECYNSDSNTGTKITVADNVVYDNMNMVPWTGSGGTGQITDGEGIIIDSNKLSNYNGAVLIENNLVYSNGAPGIEDCDSNNVTIIYNTAYQDEQSPTLNRGEISSPPTAQTSSSKTTSWRRRAESSSPPRKAASPKTTTSSTAAAVSRPRARTTFSPTRISSTRPAATSQLQSGSPAIGAANTAYTVGSDITGAPRSSSTGYDLGAYQHQGGSGTPSSITITEPASESVAAGSSVVVNGVTLADTGISSTTTLALTVSDTSGTLSMTSAAVLGSGTRSISVTDTLANLNADLATLTYTAGASAGSDSHLLRRQLRLHQRLRQHRRHRHRHAAPTITVSEPRRNRLPPAVRSWSAAPPSAIPASRRPPLSRSPSPTPRAR